MRRSPAPILAAIAVLVVSGGFVARPKAQAATPLGGVWALNRTLSEMPREIGFNVDWMPTASGSGETSGSSGGGGGGGRGRRGSSGGGGRTASSFPMPRESYIDAQRIRTITAEARTPPARLIIVDNPGTVTMTTELGESRTFHPTGREESIDIQGVEMPVVAKRDGDKLVVSYQVARDREVQYTYSHNTTPSQLVVDVEFIDRGAAGDKARRIYEPGIQTETNSGAPAGGAAAGAGAGSLPGSAAPAGTAPRGTASGGGNPPATGSAPAAGGGRGTFDERPGAELRGLTTLGILVEDLSAQAAACGLNHDAIETALAKKLSDAGFSVRKNSDEDTYLYVNVMTSASGGSCTSRFDAFLYTHATANLSYHERPVLVQVSLLHRGGLVASGPAAHPASVTHGLETFVDTFVSQIREANK